MRICFLKALHEPHQSGKRKLLYLFKIERIDGKMNRLDTTELYTYKWLR